MTDSSATFRGLDTAALDRWLPANIAGLKAPLHYSLLVGGHSNLTYRVDDAAGNSHVLRRPPLGNYPKKAHNVVREYRIYEALWTSSVPVPFPQAVCEDLSVIGAPFYVMGFVDGDIVDTPERVSAIWPSTEARQLVADNLVDSLAALHKVDIDAVGLDGLGQRDNYVARQLARMQRVWNDTKTRELPLIDELYQQLAERIPVQRHTGIVHSDFRLGNLIINKSLKVAAVLDWELSALGDVLVDLAFLINNWDSENDATPGVWMQDAPTRAGGFPDREQIVTRYTQRTGFDVSDLDYYRAFCYWRIAIIGEGMKRRYEQHLLGGEVDMVAVETRIQGRMELARYYLNRST